MPYPTCFNYGQLFWGGDLNDWLWMFNKPWLMLFRSSSLLKRIFLYSSTKCFSKWKYFFHAKLFKWGENVQFKVNPFRHYQINVDKSSGPEVFCKQGVPTNLAKVTEKHLCQSLVFNKVAGLMSVTLSKKRLWHRCSPVNFAKFLRRPFLIGHLQWLLLCWHTSKT